ncbi:DUF2480 family protein [Balneolaceae bacterium YR4-1]|uniref:DUF2480 family protein n=1 Tax=Halalkalibaculum roseum TaxID=2709311 RepID=A0A6M1SW89_9BACT|nr:DUF2480 family protein [Halalkalibaculum roseum]NGP76428.1 DUF2480 family protein [Halalkalibaculum roseum]
MSEQQGEIVNKVKQSNKLVTLDLQKYFDDTPILEFDIKDYLYEGLILKEKEFRARLENHDWEQYAGKYLVVYCSSDAIISKWAYMLIAGHASSYAKDIFKGTKEDFLFELYRRKLENVNWKDYKDKFVILKGCSSKDKPVPESVYLFAAKKLVPYVKKLMYGEACSNVPVYRS